MILSTLPTISGRQRVWILSVMTVGLLCLASSACLADVIVGGPVSGTWDLSGSPYLITGEITVPVAQSLTIEPSVEVRFQGPYRFVIAGQLRAIGAPNDTILFTAEDPEIGWGGLRFIDTTPTGQPGSEVRYCRIERGRAPGPSPDHRGGGIFIEQSDDLVIANCHLVDNKALTSLAKGGAIYGINSTPLISGNLISHNWSDYQGGGIALSHCSGAEIVGNVIDSNHGNGIHCYQTQAGIISNIISNNYTCGITNDLSDGLIIGNLLTGNIAARGAGVYNRGSSPTLTNNTISGNTSTVAGGGIFNSSNGSVTSDPVVTNTILYGNSAPTGHEVYSDGPSLPEIRYSDVQDKDGDGVFGSATWGDGLLDEDPQFIGTGDHPFNILGVSSCRDAGTPDTTGLHLPLEDLAGNLRIQNDRVDMGAYEALFGVGVPDGSLSAGIILDQNYPNPFNPGTEIKFSLAQRAVIDLWVYDLAGRLVCELVTRREYPAGVHRVIFNGRSDSEESLASGVYYYRLTSGDFHETRAMIMMK